MYHIALLIETALASGRSILEGVSRFLHEQNQWVIHHRTGPLGSLDYSGLSDWKLDGVIARINDVFLLEQLQKRGIPVIDTLGNVPTSEYPLVKCDDREIGRTGAIHFKESGFQQLGYIGLQNNRWSDERKEGFTTTARQFGLQIKSLSLPPDASSETTAPLKIDLIDHWLQSQEFPLGIMLASDQIGTLLMEVCRQRGWSIPEEISVISVDNDLPFCHLCQPRLSSIEPNHVEIGYQSAQLLQRTLNGEKDIPKLIEIPPAMLHQRASSDATAVNDPALVQALQFIKSKACAGISVDDVARECHLSRSVLQRRFRQVLHTTVGHRIRKTKLEKASEMLIYTELPIIDVAIRSGFNYQEYLNYAFKIETDETPAQFRTRHRNFAKTPK